MKKQVGNVNNDKWIFLNMMFIGNLKTNTIDIDVELDNRAIKEEHATEFEELTRNFLNGLTKMLAKNE